MSTKLEAAARQALENSQPSFLAPEWRLVRNEDITALREALAEQQAAEQTPYGWVRMNGVFNSGVFHLGATCPPGWVGAAEAVTLLVAPIQQAAEPVYPGAENATNPAKTLENTGFKGGGGYQAEQHAAEPNAVLVEGFGRVAMRKLNDLHEKGYAINGVSIATISEAGETQLGAVTTGGRVLWWPQQPAQQTAEPVEWPHKWGCRANAFGECNMGCTVQQPTQQPLTNLEGLKLAYNHHWINNLSLRDAFIQGIRDAEAAHNITSPATIAAPQLEATQQAAEPNAVLVEGFSQVALGKLNALQGKGYAINGVAIATNTPDGKTEHGAVTVHGKVLWWPQQPAQQAAGPLSFNCSAGCGACGVKLQDFVTHQTQAQEGDEWVVVDAKPQIVSACCGSPVEVWDERKKDIVARVEAAQQQAQPTQQPLTEWDPIETAPQDGTEILGYRDGKIAVAYRVPRDDCEMWAFGGTSAAIDIAPYLKPTHWMRIPAPPVEAAHGITIKEGGAQ